MALPFAIPLTPHFTLKFKHSIPLSSEELTKAIAKSKFPTSFKTPAPSTTIPPLSVLTPRTPFVGPLKPEPEFAPEDIHTKLEQHLQSLENNLKEKRKEHSPLLAAQPNPVSNIFVPFYTLNPSEIENLAKYCAKKSLPFADKLLWACKMLNRREVKGETPASRYARLNCSKWWTRALRLCINQGREMVFLRKGYVGHRGDHYISSYNAIAYQLMQARQLQWMENTVVQRVGGSEGNEDRYVLADIAKSPKESLAKTYAFVNAIDEIAIEEKLEAVMLTLTLEPEWHPNPKSGNVSWNGKTPKEGHEELGERWQSINRDLHAANIGISGLRVVEAHMDSCPHWHIWLLARADAIALIQQTIMKYFGNKLKVSDPRQALEADKVRFYDNRSDLVAESPRPATYAKEGAQVDWRCIDRSLSNGSSYVMKYLFKALKSNELVASEEDDLSDSDRKAQKDEAQGLAAYRWLWRINASQLFGVARCLTAWDELRRLQSPPESPELKMLWIYARGSDKRGYLRNTRGNPKAFLLAVGGLAACKEPKTPSTDETLVLGRMTEAGINEYNEGTKRTVGITIKRRARVQVEMPRTDKKTGKTRMVKRWRYVSTVIEEVMTRIEKWEFVPMTEEQQKERRQQTLEEEKKQREAKVSKFKARTKPRGKKAPTSASAPTILVTSASTEKTELGIEVKVEEEAPRHIDSDFVSSTEVNEAPPALPQGLSIEQAEMDMLIQQSLSSEESVFYY